VLTIFPRVSVYPVTLHAHRVCNVARGHVVGANRPFFSHSISDLESAFEERSTEFGFLEVLAAELAHRQTDRARRLADRVRAAGSGTGQVESAAPAASPVPSNSGQAPSPSVKRLDSPMPPVTNEPVQIMSAWTALEVLNPQTFGRPQELASRGDRALVADLTQGLPWEIGDRGQRD
jgi:hypothetical protein